MEPLTALAAHVIPYGEKALTSFLRQLLHVQDEVRGQLTALQYDVQRLRQSSWRAGRQMLEEAVDPNWSQDERVELLRKAVDRFLDAHGQLEGWDRVLAAADVAFTYKILDRDIHAKRWAKRALVEGVETMEVECRRLPSVVASRVTGIKQDGIEKAVYRRNEWRKFRMFVGEPTAWFKQMQFSTKVDGDPTLQKALDTGDIRGYEDFVQKCPEAQAVMRLHTMDAYLKDLRSACIQLGCELPAGTQKELKVNIVLQYALYE